MRVLVALCLIAGWFGGVAAAGIVFSRYSSGSFDASLNRSAALGFPGVFRADFFPIGGARMLWRDTLKTELIWLFGGQPGYADAPRGSNGVPLVACIQNDLWKYNITLQQWAYVKGGLAQPLAGNGVPPNCQNTPNVYGTLGVAEPGNIPGPRFFIQATLAPHGIAYIFGGYDNSVTPSIGGDLWRFNSSDENWTLLIPGGSCEPASCRTFGVNTWSMANAPGRRWGAVTWFTHNTFYMYGGKNGAYYADLWSAKMLPNGTCLGWYMEPAGSTTSAGTGDIGWVTTAGTMYRDSTDHPGTTAYAITFPDPRHSHTTFFYGGYTQAAGAQSMSHLFRYNISSQQWAWFGGSKVLDSAAWTLGTLGVFSGMATGGKPSVVMTVLPEIPNVAYFIGTGNYNVLYAMTIPDTGSAPAWVWIGGSLTAPATYSNGVIGGPFMASNVPPKIVSAAASGSVIPYTLLSSYGTCDLLDYKEIVEYSLLTPQWVVQPYGDQVGEVLPEQPQLYIIATPYELTGPVNGITAQIVVLENPTLKMTGHIVTVVDGWANFTNLAIYREGNYRLAVSLGGGAPHAVLSANFTLACEYGCAQCVGQGLGFGTSCLACNGDSGYLIGPYGDQCVHLCAGATYPRVNAAGLQQCYNCSYGCARCVSPGLSSELCQSCDESVGYLISSGRESCTSTCVGAYFANITESPHTCERCSVGCLACTGAGLATSVCQQCDRSTSFVLSRNGNACVSTCPAGQFADFTLSPPQCTVCTPGCAVCTAQGLGLACTACDETGLDYTRGRSGLCVAACPDGEYNDRDSVPHSCVKCSGACSTCDGAGTKCSGSCADSYATDPSGSCVSPCPLGMNVSVSLPPTCEAVYCSPPAGAYNDSNCPDIAVYGTQCEMQCVSGQIGVSATATCSQTTSNGPGLYIGTPTCSVCPIGTYGQSGDKECTRCGHGTTLTEASKVIQDCLCLPDYWEEEQYSGICTECPPGAACSGGHERPVAAPGFYLSNGAFLPCTPAGSCLGNNICLLGYEDYLCAQCSVGYYRLSNSCLKCDDATGWKIALGVGIGAIVCLFLVFVAIPLEYGHSGYAFATPTISLAFVQITATFLNIKLEWPAKLVELLLAFSTLNLNIELVHPECIVTFSFYDKLQMQLLVPLIIALLFVVAFCLYTTFVWYRAKDRPEALRNLKDSALMFGAGFLLFLSLVYIFLAQVSLSFFSCKELSDGHQVISSSPINLCYDDQWNAFLPLALMGVVGYIVLIPVFILGVFMYLSRRHGRLVARSHPLINFALNRYRAKYWYFEIVVIARKLLIVAISTFVVEDPVTSAVLCGIVLFCSILATTVMRPFVWEKHDFIDTLTVFTCLIILFFGILSSSAKVTESTAALLELLSLILVALSGAFMLGVFLLEVWVRYKVYKIERQDYTVTGKWVGGGERLVGMIIVGDELITATPGSVSRWKLEQRVHKTAEATAMLEHTAVALMSLDGYRFLIGTTEGFEIWDAVSFARLAWIDAPVGCGTMTHVTGTDTWVSSAHADGTVVVWQRPSGSSIEMPTVLMERVSQEIKGTTATGSSLYIALHGGQIMRWDVDLETQTFNRCGGWRTQRGVDVGSIAVQGDILVLAAGFVVQGINMKSGEVAINMPGHKGEACFTMTHEDYIYTGTWTGEVRRWNAETGAYIERCVSQVGAVRTVLVRDGFLYSAGKDGSVLSWQLQGNTVLEEVDPLRVWWRRFRQRYRVLPGPALMEMDLRLPVDDLLSVKRGTPELQTQDSNTHSGEPGSDQTLMVPLTSVKSTASLLGTSSIIRSTSTIDTGLTASPTSSAPIILPSLPKPPRGAGVTAAAADDGSNDGDEEGESLTSSSTRGRDAASLSELAHPLVPHPVKDSPPLPARSVNRVASGASLPRTGSNTSQASKAPLKRTNTRGA